MVPPPPLPPPPSPPSAARPTARSNRAITCDAWNWSAPTSLVVAVGEPSPPSPPVPPTCQSRRHWVNLTARRPGRATPRTHAITLVADRRDPSGSLIAARLRTSAIFCAILSIAALSFVSASSAIVAVVVAGRSVPSRRRCWPDPSDDQSRTLDGIPSPVLLRSWNRLDRGGMKLIKIFTDFVGNFCSRECTGPGERVVRHLLYRYHRRSAAVVQFANTHGIFLGSYREKRTEGLCLMFEISLVKHVLAYRMFIKYI